MIENDNELVQAPEANEPQTYETSQLPAEIAQAQELERQKEQQTQAHEELPKQPLSQTLQAKTPQESFRELKEKAIRMERERNEAMERLAALENKKSEPEEDFNIDPNELAEGKHLKKMYSEIKKLKSEINVYHQKSSELATHAALKVAYPDLDRVVSPENIERLRAEHPEIAATINSSGDLYNKAASAYKMIKTLGIYHDDKYKAEKDRIVANLSKPRAGTSAQAFADSPIQRAGMISNSNLNDDVKKQLFKEMNEYRRGY